MKTWCLAFLCLCAWTLPAMAGSSMSIRLVEASAQGKGDSSGLEDVVDVLKKNLPLPFYTLVDRTRISLPANGKPLNLGSYTITCTGSQDALVIVVQQGARKLLQTSVKLDNKSPLVLGGFPSEKGKMVLVFVVK